MNHDDDDNGHEKWEREVERVTLAAVCVFVIAEFQLGQSIKSVKVTNCRST